MFQHFDIVISFVAVMLVASLAVTAGTQLVICLFGLRGANLQRSLADLFETASDDRDAKRYARVIARRVLRQPLVSGSVFSRFGIRLDELPFMPADAAGKLRWAGSGIPLQPWLLGALSGTFLWPLSLFLINHLFAVDFCAYAGAVTNYIPFLNLCGHPWLSGAILGAVFGGLLSRWRLATSIRLDELVSLLEKLSAPAGGTLPDPAQRAMLVLAGETRSGARPKINTGSAQMERMFRDASEEGDGGVAVAVEKAVAQSAVHAETRVEGLNLWFDHAMDRASQRFTVQARVITVVLSLVLVFGAHLDAVRLFQSLSADAQRRAELSDAAAVLTRQAEQLSRAKEGSRTVVPDVYRTAMAAVLEIVPAEQPKGRSRRSSRASAAAAASSSSAAESGDDKATVGAKSKAMKALEARPGFASREDAALWLRETLDGDPALENLAAAYEQEVNAALPSDADKLLDHSASLQRELVRTRVHLLPEVWPGWTPGQGELPGLLLTVAFLCLGAAICYNLLKSLASLRPMRQIK